jgi:hypothetical protein
MSYKYIEKVPIYEKFENSCSLYRDKYPKLADPKLVESHFFTTFTKL